MLGLARSVIEKATLYVLRRRQYTSIKLRDHFREKHRITVGKYSYGCFDQWRMRPPMTVGRYCSFSNTSRSVRMNHELDALTTHPCLYESSFGVVPQDIDNSTPLVVEDDVWVAHNVVILPGCSRIGRGAIIGAGAVVTKDVPPYAVMVGNPARKIRDRFDPELIEAIEASRWWELELSDLRELVATRRDMIYHPTVGSLAAWLGEKTS